MKLRFTAFLSIALLITLAACQSKKESKMEEVTDQVTFSSQDSLDVRALVDEYLTHFNANEMEAAADMIYFVRNDSVFPLAPEKRAGFLAAMNSLPRYGAGLASMSLYNELDNQVRIAILMDESGDLLTEQNTINFYLNPVKLYGQWYLTLADKYAEGVGHYNN